MIGLLNSNASIVTEEDLARDVKNLFLEGSWDFVRQVMDSYPASEYQSVFDRKQAMIGDLYTNCPTAWILKASAKKYRGTWKMQFNAANQSQGASGAYLYDTSFDRKSVHSQLHHLLTCSRPSRIE